MPVDISTLSDDDDLYGAGLNSHTSVVLMLALEDEFAVEFPDELLRRGTFSTITAIRDAIVQLQDDQLSVS
jgi:acyl carrier protein